MLMPDSYGVVVATAVVVDVAFGIVAG